MSVFISFVHEDAAIAAAVADFLRQNGDTVFLTADDWLLYAGEVWLERIRAELTKADVVVTIFSNRSVARPWIHFEAGAAWFSEKLLIPLCIGGFDLNNLPMPYRGIQAINLADYGSAYYLIRSIFKFRTRNVTPTPTTPPPFPLDRFDRLRSALEQYVG